MKANKVIPAVFLAVIIAAIVWGVVLHNNSGASPTLVTTNTAVNAPLQRGLYDLEYKVVFGGFAKEIMGVNGSSYVIVLNGVFNYPPSNVTPGTYTLLSISGNITFANSTQTHFVIPLYQEISIDGANSEKFYIVLQGNSPAVVQVYNYLEHLKDEGIYTAPVEFNIMMANASVVQIEGEIYL
ncbi:hypothetical protein [Stygiolobus caldivivus]|uniref:Uncharacterized protein n=1 Tax=Stygiolobus caldivivus TaxID=2824673 RepID=A0A8D5U6C8_9CREN|nr:hypothetical protein [Stygiolobus caldivivus]BCU69817.1 hypothetical protein KN1_11140 [Stygiolobus caldivivus]